MLGMPVASLSRAWLAGSGGRLWQARQASRVWWFVVGARLKTHHLRLLPYSNKDPALGSNSLVIFP